MKLLLLHVSVIKFDRINFTLFYSENINLPSEKLENVRQIKWNHAYLFIIMIQLGLLPFLLIYIFQSLSRHHFKACKYFMWAMTNRRTINFRFYLWNLSFLIKHVQLNAPAVNLDKGLTNDKYDIPLQTFYSYLMNTD